MKLKKFLCIGLLTALTVCLAGCKKIKVFETQEDKSGITTYKKGNLENDKVYIKDGAVFMLPSETVQKADVFFYLNGFDDIPTLYKGEVLAYANDAYADYNSLKLTRLKSVGYTFGTYAGSLINGEYVFVDDDIMETSFNYNVFPHSNKQIRISALYKETEENEEDKVNLKDAFKDGVLGANSIFEPYTEHLIECYIGTKNYKGTLKNDVFTLVPFEEYELRKIELTKNGYIQIEMDTDMKSGYYFVDNLGIFRYVATEKANAQNIYDIDYYEPLYALIETEDEDTLSEEKTDTETSTPNNDTTFNKVQTYSINIKEKKYDYVFTVNYDTSSQEPMIVLKSPNNQTYVMELEREGVKSVTIAEVNAGEWTVLINNLDVNVLNISATEKENVVATKEVSETFEIEKLMLAQKVSIEYTGKILNAYVVDANNEVTVIKPIKNGLYEYTFDFLDEGTYKVVVVCTEDTDVTSIALIDNSNYETEIIVVE